MNLALANLCILGWILVFILACVARAYLEDKRKLHDLLAKANTRWQEAEADLRKALELYEEAEAALTKANEALARK